jgi:hypothetical protein
VTPCFRYSFSKRDLPDGASPLIRRQRGEMDGASPLIRRQRGEMVSKARKVRPGRSGNVGAPTQNQPTFFIFWLNRAKFDRTCECPANGPAWSRTSSMRGVAGLCGNLLEFAGPLLEFAGHCGTLRDTAGGRRRRRPATPSPWRPNPFAP